MIIEDYCSFEIAKLLKEKGFDAEIKTYWRLGVLNEPILEFVEDSDVFDVSNSDGFVGFNGVKYSSVDIVCIAPTLQMAMKWLREIYGLHVWVEYSRFDFNNERPYLWNIVETKFDGCYWGGSYHKRPETAVEEAIKYSITNLI